MRDLQSSLRECIDAIESIACTERNCIGKREDVEKVVAFMLLTDSLDALKEIEANLSQKDFISINLLTRYIFENFINFRYIFTLAEKQTIRKRVHALYYYNLLQQAILLEKDIDIAKYKHEWKFFREGKENYWAGKSLKRLVSEVWGEKHYNKIYKGMSFFAHPGMYALERIFVKESKIFPGLQELNILGATSNVIEMYNTAVEKSFAGINKNTNDFENKKKKLKSIEENMAKQLASK